MQIPKEIASLKLAVGDKNKNGKVDVSSTLVLAGREIGLGSITKDVPFDEALAVMLEAKEFIESKLGKK